MGIDWAFIIKTDLLQDLTFSDRERQISPIRTKKDNRGNRGGEERTADNVCVLSLWTLISNFFWQKENINLCHRSSEPREGHTCKLFHICFTYGRHLPTELPWPGADTNYAIIQSPFSKQHFFFYQLFRRNIQMFKKADQLHHPTATSLVRIQQVARVSCHNSLYHQPINKTSLKMNNKADIT